MNAETIRLFGASPAAISGVVVAAALGFGLLPRTRNRLAAGLGAAGGAALLFGAQTGLTLLPASAVPTAALLLGILAAWAVAQLLACQSIALNRLSGPLLLLGWAISWTMDSGWSSLLALSLGALAMLDSPPESAVAGATDSGSLLSIGARTIICAMAYLALGVTWAVFRGPLLPAESGLAAIALVLVAGWGAPGRPWVVSASLLAGATGVGWITFFSSGFPDHMGRLARALATVSPRLAETDVPALVLLGSLGLTGALLVRGVAPRPREQAAAALGAALLLPPLLPLLPTGVAVRAGSSLVSIGADPGLRDRLDSQRARLPLQHAVLGPSGAALIRGDKGQLLAELDGSVVDPESRAVQGERFAGTLGACLVAGRASARVAGDDLGLALTALLAQGFPAIDTAVPDPDRLSAWSRLSATARKAWVHPATRILTLPAPFVAQGGVAADVVVNILRNGWTDARQAVPGPSAISATRRSLRPGGVYVLSVTTTRIDAEAFLGLAHAFAAAFPSTTVWLPPVGVDTALFVGSLYPEKRYDWALLAGCIDHDREALRRVAVRSPADLAGLLLGDQSTIPDLPAPTGRRMPQRLAAGDTNPLSSITASAWDPTSAWTGTGVDESDLRARHESLLRFQDTLAHAASGDMQGAIAAARSLSTAPGGGRSVETLVSGYLDQARRLAERAGREGPDSKSWPPAETALANARLLYPELAEIWCVEGKMDELRGQMPRAEEAYATCAEKEPDRLEALDGLGRIRQRSGNFTGAEQAMRAAVARHPESWASKFNLGWLYFTLRRYTDAEPLLRAAVSDSAHAADPPLNPHLALASLYLATDRPALALGEANAVVAIQPSANALALRGEARLHLNQTTEAERDFRAALELNPDDVSARGGLGNVQALKGDYDGALASWKAVLALDPQNDVARANLQTLAQMGKE